MDWIRGYRVLFIIAGYQNSDTGLKIKVEDEVKLTSLTTLSMRVDTETLLH